MQVVDAQTRNASNKRTVLLVEDDEQVAAALCAVLEDAGYTIARASNGKDALDQLSSRSVDAIVLDLMLPIMDGWEFVSAQKASRVLAEIPVIVISADHSAKARAIRADRALKKPFAAEQLLVALDELLFALDRKTLAARIEEAEELLLRATWRAPAAVAASQTHPQLRGLGFELQQLRVACKLATSPEDVRGVDRAVALLLSSVESVSSATCGASTIAA